MIRVEQVLDSWRAIGQDTAAAVEDFPAGELDYRPTPEVGTFREYARHILDASDVLTGLLLAGDEDFTELTHRAQLFMYLRLKGIVPATTRRRLAKQAAK